MGGGGVVVVTGGGVVVVLAIVDVVEVAGATEDPDPIDT